MFWMKLAMAMSLVSSIKITAHRYQHPPIIRCAGMRLFSITPSVTADVFDGITGSILCKTPEDIENLGSRVAAIVGNGDVILLKGDLGAGKTTFTRGLIRSKFEDEDMRVTSPSYLLDNVYEYDESQYIHHMDLYRLPTGCDLSILGIPEIYGTSLCIIEWPQRMGANVPNQYLDVDINIGDDETRRIKFTAVGKNWVEKLKILFN